VSRAPSHPTSLDTGRPSDWEMSMNDPEVTMLDALSTSTLTTYRKAIEAAGLAIELVQRVPAPLKSLADLLKVVVVALSRMLSPSPPLYPTLMLKLKLTPPLPLVTVPAPGWAGGLCAFALKGLVGRIEHPASSIGGAGGRSDVTRRARRSAGSAWLCAYSPRTQRHLDRNLQALDRARSRRLPTIRRGSTP